MNIANELNIDYELLIKQKEELIAFIWDKPESNLWGLIGILDSLTDGLENNRG